MQCRKLFGLPSLSLVNENRSYEYYSEVQFWAIILVSSTCFFCANLPFDGCGGDAGGVVGFEYCWLSNAKLRYPCISTVCSFLNIFTKIQMKNAQIKSALHSFFFFNEITSTFLLILYEDSKQFVTCTNKCRKQNDTWLQHEFRLYRGRIRRKTERKMGVTNKYTQYETIVSMVFYCMSTNTHAHYQFQIM